MKYARLWRMAIFLTIVILCFVVWLRTTHLGTITGTYLVGGFFAPPAIRVACIQETNTRVEEKFRQPLSMNDEGIHALREYWHYAFYRECLYRAGYAFLGSDIPEPALVPDNGTVWYENPLAGIRLLVPTYTQVVTSNVLDVTFDYRRYMSELAFGTSTLTIELYTSFDAIVDHATLHEHIDTILPDGSSMMAHELRTNRDGLAYTYVSRTDGTCTAAWYTPHDRIVLLHTPCTADPSAISFADSLRYLTSVPSLH